MPYQRIHRNATAVVLTAVLLTCCKPTSPAPQSSTALSASTGAPGSLDPAASAPAHATAAPAEHQDELAHAGLPTKIRLSAEVSKAAGIQLSPVRMEVLPVTVDVSGEIVPDPDGSASVSVRAPGRIVAVKFKVGQWVKDGELLAVVESAELARARATYIATYAKAVAKRHHAERLAMLTQKGLGPEYEAQLVSAEATALEADARAARATLTAFGQDAVSLPAEAARLELRAPMSGYVLTRNAIIGQPVTADWVIADIARFDHAYFLARLFEKDLAYVTTDSVADVHLNAYPGVVLPGTLESIGKQIDPTARTVIARIRVTDQDGMLKSGLFGTARIAMQSGTGSPQTNRAASQLVIPLSAVTDIAGHAVVFVQHTDGDFEVHPVTLGRSAAGKVVVLNGLRAGEKVVSGGVFTLKSAVLKSTFGEEEGGN